MDNILKKISASLEFGAIYSGFFLGFLYAMLFLGIITSCLILAIAILEDIRLLICFFVLFIISLCFIIVIIINHNNCKKIKKWAEDSVRLTAYSSSLDNAMVFSGFIPLRAKKISVKFKYDGRTIIKESGRTGAHISSLNGYSALLKKYADREIDILYSPKYDQVMILKDKQ